MKILILSILFFISNNCFAQSILQYFKIKEIKKIEISFSPDMNFDDQNVVYKISTDKAFLREIKMMLADMPATGTIWKSFPQTIPTWRIKIFNQKNKPHILTYFGVKLRVPDSSTGGYYQGKEKHENEKKLYLAIRNFMIGSK